MPEILTLCQQAQTPTRPNGKAPGTWFFGELRVRTQHEDGSWSANVMWSHAHGENRLDTVPAAHVRPPTGA
jgi:hypothetical protein